MHRKIGTRDTNFMWKNPFGKNRRHTKSISLYEDIFTIKLLLFSIDYKNIFIVVNERLRIGVEL